MAALGLYVLWAHVSPAFTPFRSELTDPRGFSRGLLNFAVLPSDSAFPHVPVWVLAAAGVVAFGLSVPGFRPARRRIETALEGGALTLLSAAALSPLVTSSRVVFAPRTFALLVLLLSWSRLRVVPAAVAARWGTGRVLTPWVRIAVAGALAAAFFASMMLQQLAAYDGNYSGFLHLSRRVAAGAPFLQERQDLARTLIVADEGYDGQFMYLMAFDPLLQRFKDAPATYRRVVDDPPYRYGRMGFVWLARIFSGGAPERFPAALVWLTVLAHIPLGMAFAAIAQHAGRSPFEGLAYLAIPGFAVSTAFALPEALAAAGLVGGVALTQREKYAWATVCFSAALLVRETGALLIAMLFVAALLTDRRRAFWFVAAVVPMALWRLFVAGRLLGEFGSHAILTNPGDLGPPFAGLAPLVIAGLTNTQAAPEGLAAIVFPLVLAAALVLAAWSVAIRRGALAFAAAGYGLVAVSLNYDKIWRHLPSGERGTFELFVVLLLVGLGGRDMPRRFNRALVGLFAILAVYTLYVSPQAGASRAALLLIR